MKFRSRIALRIFAFNALLVFLPVAAFSLLGSYERGIVDSLEQSLAQQARVTAAWLGRDAEGPRLDPALAKRALAAIGARRTARFRVVDADGRLLADSSAPGEPAPAEPTPEAAAPMRAAAAEAPAVLDGESAIVPGGEPLIYRFFSAPTRLWRHFLAPPAPALSSADFYASAGPRLLGSEVLEALAGKYGRHRACPRAASCQ